MRCLFLSIIFISIIILSGCAQWGAVKTAVADRGAHVADEALDVAIWQLCNASTYGAIKREFAGNVNKATALKVLCDGTEEVNLVQ